MSSLNVALSCEATVTMLLMTEAWQPQQAGITNKRTPVGYTATVAGWQVTSYLQEVLKAQLSKILQLLLLLHAVMLAASCNPSL
jgi:hypothetical protein